jgi:hypothetical protein
MGRNSFDNNADAALAKLGYKAELPRNLSMMSVMGLYVFSSPKEVPDCD